MSAKTTKKVSRSSALVIANYFANYFANFQSFLVFPQTIIMTTAGGQPAVHKIDVCFINSSLSAPTKSLRPLLCLTGRLVSAAADRDEMITSLSLARDVTFLPLFNGAKRHAFFSFCLAGVDLAVPRLLLSDRCYVTSIPVLSTVRGYCTKKKHYPLCLLIVRSCGAAGRRERACRAPGCQEGGVDVSLL